MEIWYERLCICRLHTQNMFFCLPVSNSNLWLGEKHKGNRSYLYLPCVGSPYLSAALSNQRMLVLHPGHFVSISTLSHA